MKKIAFGRRHAMSTAAAAAAVIVAALVVGAGSYYYASSTTTPSTTTTTTTVVSTTTAASAASNAIEIAYKPAIGFYLTNSTGYTLYFRSTDKPNTGTTTCTTDVCEKNWPAFYVANLAAPTGVSVSDFAVVTAYNSTKIVTYDGYPLFYWLHDTQPGDTTGQGIGGFYVATVPTPTIAGTTAAQVAALAFSHWTAIGDANLTAIMSQYSTTASLWWYVKGSALNTVSQAYTGNNISATWSKFLGVGPTYWTVYNFTTTVSQTSAKVTADLWYVVGSGSTTKTLHIPYELDYSYQNGHWVLMGDWWGLPNNYGAGYPGVVSPS